VGKGDGEAGVLAHRLASERGIDRGEERDTTMELYYRTLARLTTRVAETIDRLREEHGQTFTEYAIIVATIAVGTVAGLRPAPAG
jgi:hypothetical protein